MLNNALIQNHLNPEAVLCGAYVLQEGDPLPHDNCVPGDLVVAYRLPPFEKETVEVWGNPFYYFLPNGHPVAYFQDAELTPEDNAIWCSMVSPAAARSYFSSSYEERATIHAMEQEPFYACQFVKYATECVEDLDINPAVGMSPHSAY